MHHLPNPLWSKLLALLPTPSKASSVCNVSICDEAVRRCFYWGAPCDSRPLSRALPFLQHHAQRFIAKEVVLLRLVDIVVLTAGDPHSSRLVTTIHFN